MQDERVYPFDVFISYRWITPDREWVRNQLYPALRNAGLRVCLDVEDFVAGRHLILETERAGLQSHRTLCVITPKYFEEGRMVEFESLSARRRDPAGRNSLLIPLILRETTIPERIQDLISINWTNPTDHLREWKKLLQILEAPNLNAQPPGPLPTEFQNLSILSDRIEPPFQSTAVRLGNGLWKWRIHIYFAAALIILTLSVLAITQVLPNKSDTINANPSLSPPASPQPTTTPPESTTPTPGPTPSVPARPRPTRSSDSQRATETPCPPKDRLIAKC